MRLDKFDAYTTKETLEYSIVAATKGPANGEEQEEKQTHKQIIKIK